MSRAERKTHAIKRVGKTWSAWQEIPVTDEIRKSSVHMARVHSIWANSRCEIHCFACPGSIGGTTHCVVARHGLLEHVTNSEMMRIKLELFGIETTAVEIFPSGVTELSEKTRHMWVLPVGHALPFGFDMDSAWGSL